MLRFVGARVRQFYGNGNPMNPSSLASLQIVERENRLDLVERVSVAIQLVLWLGLQESVGVR